ncbi:hypothetical protein [Paraburkholderia sp. J8-2]|uniref:hypothetical protein n=1 Tax=Paraburkholderia sp. J8-2 TaxID=2805440 RepID=UPI002AB6CA64|nr:hypothetical protein [Paraburkholderia sp. J8-2]
MCGESRSLPIMVFALNDGQYQFEIYISAADNTNIESFPVSVVQVSDFKPEITVRIVRSPAIG